MPHRGVGIDEVNALSGSFAAVSTTQPSMENYSGSVCALSVNNEDDSTLTVVPVVGNVSLLTASTADQQSPGSRRRLFFAQASPDTTEDQIKQLVTQYGVVESVQLLNDGNDGLSNGCGYITMATNEQAAAALVAMQQNPQFPSPVGFLNVGYPLTDDASAAATAAGNGPVPSLVANAGRTLFFAKVPPTALASEVELLFGSFGKLAEVNLFRAWAGAKHSKGCGLITYVDRQCAANAIAQLHGKYVFPGSDCPMVVEWMDLKKQRPVAPPLAADKPPLGCAHDAYKLLLSNVPPTVTEADLSAVLRQYGHVVQLALTPDSSGASASGYVWYATKQAADGLQTRVKVEPLWLRDARTNQELALCVRRSRKPGIPGPPRQNTMTPNAAHMSSSSNSNSSNLLPLIHLGSGDMSGQVAHMQRLAAAQGGMDISMLGPDVVRLLPVQQMSAPLPQIAAANGYMAADVCETMLDVYDTNMSMGSGMPVHLQPSIAAQMETGMTLQRPNQQRTANSQICVLANNMLHSSGQHCMSSPANIMAGLNEFEGSFNMSLSKSFSHQINGVQPATQQVVAMGQQQLIQQQSGSLIWQQPPQQQMIQVSQAQQQQLLMIPSSVPMAAQAGQVQLMSQQQQLQQQRTSNSQVTTGVAGTKSIAVPIEPYEVHLIAENLMLFSARSGAQVTITSLPGAALAIMITGRPDQVAAAQQLVASVRNRS